jgi:hypothetical protein
MTLTGSRRVSQNRGDRRSNDATQERGVNKQATAKQHYQGEQPVLTGGHNEGSYSDDDAIAWETGRGKEVVSQKLL